MIDVTQEDINKANAIREGLIRNNNLTELSLGKASRELSVRHLYDPCVVCPVALAGKRVYGERFMARLETGAPAGLSGKADVFFPPEVTRRIQAWDEHGHMEPFSFEPLEEPPWLEVDDSPGDGV
jgi:hypothetical protein